MKITVKEQPQQFYLALPDKWVPVAGHEIKVDKYQFCAIPINNHINVSEVTTGTKVLNIPVDFVTALLTETKEDTIQYFYQIGERVKKAIEKVDDFDAMLEKMKKKTVEKLGEMPSIEDVDVTEMGVSVDE